MRNKITAVVVTFNRLEKLKESIHQLIHQSSRLYKVIIVNNHSSDGTQKYLESLAKKNLDWFVVINLDQNLGGAGGFHVGAKRAVELGSDWVALSDDDAMYDSQYFELIENQINKESDYLAFSGNVLSDDGYIQKNHRRKIVNWATLKARPLSEKEYTKNIDIDIFSFVGSVISRKVFDQIGFPNADFFINDDDTEFSLRIRKIGKIMNVHKATIIHKSSVMVDETSAKLREKWILFYGIRNHNYNVFRYSNNILIAHAYIFLQSVKRYIILLFGRHFKGRRLYFLKLFILAGKEARHGNLGIESRYFPGN